MARGRLDQLLVARQLMETRSKARDVILQGLVRVAGKVVRKPGALVGGVAVIQLPREVGRYVSRGASKLATAMDAFCFDATGIICLDVGASTGGFTQILLERGAAQVYATKGAWLAALIKPQFEAGREAVGKGGIVRDAGDRLAAVESVRDWLGLEAGWRVIDVVPLPITGGSGNQEFLIGAVYDKVTSDKVTGDGCENGGVTSDGVTIDGVTSDG